MEDLLRATLSRNAEALPWCFDASGLEAWLQRCYVDTASDAADRLGAILILGCKMLSPKY